MRADGPRDFFQQALAEVLRVHLGKGSLEPDHALREIGRSKVCRSRRKLGRIRAR